jgi:hypothetical protein
MSPSIALPARWSINNWSLYLNNSYKRFLVVAVLLSIGVITSHAQDTPATPTPPYVADMPDFCQWTMTVTVEDSTDKSKPPPAPSPGTVPAIIVLKVSCTRTKDIKRDIVFYSNGNHTEVWYYRNFVIIRRPNGEFTVDRPGSVSALFDIPDESVKGFYGVAWINAGNFQGSKKLEGREVYIYNGISKAVPPPLPSAPTFDRNGQPVIAPPSPEVKLSMEVVIAVDSRLPLVIKQDKQLFTYSYEPPPTQMLELPADMQKKLASMAEAADLLNKLKSLSQH